MDYINLTLKNLDREHLCCANAGDKKHLLGVRQKKDWLRDRIPEGHVFRKLDARGKVFIEYAPLERAWVPVLGEDYLYIYCLWVSGSFKEQGHGRALLGACIEDARARGKSGVCAVSAGKKKPFLSDGKFLLKHGFRTVDTAGEYELLALSFDGSVPRFTEGAKKQRIEDDALTIYYSPQCPYIADCVLQVDAYCSGNGIAHNLIPVDSLQRAKALPCVFNNWATFYGGEFVGVHPLNEGQLKKLLG